MRLALSLALLVSTAAWSQDTIKVFQDKGNFFLKVDKKKPIAVGTEVDMYTDAEGTKKAGSAMVMEVNGALARVTLDEDATKANARFAKPAASAVADSKPTPSVATRKKEPEPNVPQLKGRLSSGLRVVVNNDSDTTWTDCTLKYDDGRYYEIGEVPSNSDDTVLVIKFKSPPSPPEPLYDHVVVTCDQGETKMFFNNPRSPGELKGYAENMGSGRVDLHNTSDVTWQRCDIKKPNGTHFVLASLRPRDKETIRSGAFVKEAEQSAPPATELAINCKQGRLKIDLK